MQRRLHPALLLSAFLWVQSIGGVRAEHFILGTDPLAAESGSYQQGLFALALEHADGDHTYDYVPFRVNQGRAFRELAAGTAAFNVIDSGYDRERETMLTMVYVPLTRGLLGHRLLAVRQDKMARFAGIDTFAALRAAVSFGSGPTWPDTAILRHAGLRVVTGEKNQLYSMLRRERFLAYPRGVQEITAEIAFHNAAPVQPHLEIEPTAMLAYRYDAFFFTAPGDTRRAEILEEGLLNAYDSGAFMDYFRTHPDVQRGLAEVGAHERRVFRLENPSLSDRVRQIPARYWHDFDAAAD